MSIDITPEQWTVLCYLWSRDGVTQQELCNATFKDKPSMTRLIDNLEKQQLVVRSSGVKDRRINLIHLTDKGRELEMETKPLVTAVMREALEGFSDKEVEIAGHEFTEDTHFAASNAFSNYLYFTDGTSIYRLDNGPDNEIVFIASLDGLTTVDGEAVGSINEIVDMKFRVEFRPTTVNETYPTYVGVQVLTVAYNTADGGGITEIYLSTGGDLDHTTSYAGFGPIVDITYMSRSAPIGGSLTGSRDYID